MVIFYCNVYKKLSHILGLLTDLAGKCGKMKSTKAKLKWHWDKIHQDAFNESKEMLKNSAKLVFPDFLKPFHFWSNASDIQLGVTLIQDRILLGFYTHKLNTAQRNYSVGEKELLCLVDGIKAFDGMICDMNLIIHTNQLVTQQSTKSINDTMEVVIRGICINSSSQSG